jgi:cytochrome c oxidase subunit II
MRILRTRTLTSWVAAAVAGTALLSEGTVVSSSRQDPATVSAPQTIEVVARKFSFEPDRIEVTEGDRVRLVVRSEDGVHGLQIKRFGVNKFIPRGGEAVTIDFTASRAGTFEILCSEYCGNKHDDMKGTLVVLAKPTN